MNEYILATASTCDLDLEYLQEHEVPFISYSFIIEGVPYEDDCTKKTKEFVYQSMRSGKMVNTSAITVFAYEEFFRNLLKTGKDVIYTDMSRAISSSIANCEQAIATVQKEFPNQRITLIDSFNITGGLALFVKALVKRKEEGMSYDDLVAWGEEHKKEYVHRFMVEDLQWLRRGGRLSNASAMVGSLLSIKPMLYVAEDGKLVAFQKVHGRKKCLKQLVETMKEDMADCTVEEITVISADDDEECLKEMDLIRETYPQFKDADILLTHLGPTICAHVGPDFMAICYHGSHRVM